MTEITTYSYDERNAIIAIRKAMMKKPAIIHEIMRGLAQEHAVGILQRAGVELNQLLEVSRAFSAAAAALVKQQKEKTND